MPKLVWLNGDIMPLESAVTSVADHAHLYGDGLFEGIRLYHGKIFKFDEHLKRLYHGCAYLGYEMNIGYDQMRSTVLDVCKQADISDGYIRLNVTRGTGLGLDPKNINRTPNVMIMISTLALYAPEMYEIGLSVVTSAVRVIPADALDPRVKCIGRYAANIVAKNLANKAGAGDGLLLNHQGYIAEGTGNNFFVVTDGALRTPPPSAGILKGITRDVTMQLARERGYEVREENLTLYDVFAAEEAFFTGTATEIIPAISLDGTKINCGQPGRITQELMAAFAEHTHTGVAF